MGLLVDGKWQDKWYDTGKSGKFERSQSQFRDFVTADGAETDLRRDVPAGSRPRLAATISMSRSPAPGRIAR